MEVSTGVEKMLIFTGMRKEEIKAGVFILKPIIKWNNKFDITFYQIILKALTI